MKKYFSKFKYAFIALAILLFAVVVAISVPKINQSVSKITDTLVDSVNSNKEEVKELKVHYFDVGQGDCEFIELPNGETILIDAGEREKGQAVVEKIMALGYKKIDYVIATHPHSDHIGGLIDVFNLLDIKSIYLPDCSHTTKTYENLLDCIAKEKCKVIKAFCGVEMIDKDDVYAYFVAPNSDDYENINNYSACLMLKYGERSFLFMGDAEKEAEYEIPSDLTCDVVKVGHHGSDTSSSYNFVSRTYAKYAVISVGKNNDYGHPSDSVITQWKENGTIIFRTDLNGDIMFITDGKNITYQNQFSFKDKDDIKRNPNIVVDNNIVTEIQQNTTKDNDESSTTYSSKSEYKYVVNTKTKKIHNPMCDSVEKIAQQNRKYTNKSIAELQKEGYKPCGNCQPSE